jgi:acetyl esterase/lipase
MIHLIRRKLFLISSISIINARVGAQQIIPLYNGPIPNSTGYVMKETPWIANGIQIGYGKISQPTLTIYLPPKEIATRTAIIICPGGSYQNENYKLEGTNIAETFVKHGIAAFILKYRLPSDSIMKDKSIGPLQDAQQAIKIVHEMASKWNVDTSKIGIIGFSAGGHLASSAGTHFSTPYILNPENTNLRPAFMILIYPVISMTDSLAHLPSRESLLGKKPTLQNKQLFSNELQVTSNAPPSWITHTGDDRVVSVLNSIRFYEALIRNNVQAEMHLYPSGDHGFVLNQPTEVWMKPLFEWMQKNNWIKGGAN